MEDSQSDRRRSALAAIRRSARVARSRGVPVLPLKESREHLAIVFDDPRERAEVLAVYWHLEDAIAFNTDHPAWSDMRVWTKVQQRSLVYSTAHLRDILLHELGHAAHYHALSPKERGRIWFTEDLRPEEELIAPRVSIRATWNPEEFVAEVFADLRGRVEYDDEVIALFERYEGQGP